jgi:hypothetical protein
MRKRAGPLAEISFEFAEISFEFAEISFEFAEIIGRRDENFSI